MRVWLLALSVVCVACKKPSPPPPAAPPAQSSVAATSPRASPTSYELVTPLQLRQRAKRLDGKGIEIVDVIANPFGSGYAPPEIVLGFSLQKPNGEAWTEKPELGLRRLRGVLDSAENRITVYSLTAELDTKTYEKLDRARLDREGRSLDRKRVEYVGKYRSGFEQSSLDDVIWISFANSAIAESVARARVERKIEPGSVPKVRARGRLATNGGYGHLGRRHFELRVEELEYL